MEQNKKYGRLTKELMFKELKELFDKNENLFVIGSDRLPTSEVEFLRRNLRQEAARYVVVKNTLCHQVLKAKSCEGIAGLVKGHAAIVFGKGDPSGIAKVIVQFAQRHETFRINGALLSGEEMDPATIRVLASLPSRAVLIAKTVGAVKAPITGLVFNLSGLLRQLVIALDRVRQTKE